MVCTTVYSVWSTVLHLVWPKSDICLFFVTNGLENFPVWSRVDKVWFHWSITNFFVWFFCTPFLGVPSPSGQYVSWVAYFTWGRVYHSNFFTPEKYKNTLRSLNFERLEMFFLCKTFEEKYSITNNCKMSELNKIKLSRNS